MTNQFIESRSPDNINTKISELCDLSFVCYQD
jgi:hypothetical protein